MQKSDINAKNIKVLLIEDNSMLAESIETYLLLKNFDVDVSFDGEVAISKIDTQRYDLYIIDINIPYINGLDIVRYIRKKDLLTPIIIITASVEYTNFELAYENGCDEYIKKPFHIRELDVLIHKQLRIQKKEPVKISDNIIYNPETLSLSVDGKAVHLRKKESRLLDILLRNINHTVGREEIIDYVWENEIKETYFLRQLVNKLKKNFPQDSDFIKTYVGVGYSFETTSPNL